jgi:hypothetical protein
MADVPKNVRNPALYKKARAEAKRKFDVWPSAYASGYLVKRYKELGGTYSNGKAKGGEINSHTMLVKPRGFGRMLPGKQKMARVPRG